MFYNNSFLNTVERSRQSSRKSRRARKASADDPIEGPGDGDVVIDEIIVAQEPVMDFEMEGNKSKSDTSGIMMKQPLSAKQIKGKKKTTSKNNSKESGSSSDEERWLEKIKDPKLMTARQRAMYERGNTEKDQIPLEALVSLPTGYKEKVLTAEDHEKALLKSQKRKQLADEKREKDKRKTMERLLKKQDSKLIKSKSRQAKTTVPTITYRSTADGSVIIFPPNTDFPIFSPKSKEQHRKPAIVCSIPGCGNLKRYNCSKTDVPLCSFACYKQNVASIIC